MPKEHAYSVTVTWTGNLGDGTSGYRAYSRDHVIASGDKPPLPGSSDPAFRGDAARYNPEDLLVAAVSACHMLWYLHLCAVRGIRVLGYVDEASGVMAEEPDGGGRFTKVVLRPRITLAEGADAALAGALHEEAHAKCFIANSVNFPIEHRAEIRTGAG